MERSLVILSLNYGLKVYVIKILHLCLATSVEALVMVLETYPVSQQMAGKVAWALEVVIPFLANQNAGIPSAQISLSRCQIQMNQSQSFCEK